MKMKKLIMISLILLAIFLTSGSALAQYRHHYSHFGIFIGPPTIWIGPPAIIHREYYPPPYYPPPYYPPPYYYPPDYYDPYRIRLAKILIEVSPTPDNCDLEVNGVYQGSTPASIELTQGVTVTIKLTKADYLPWEKTVLPKPGMRISPELEKKPN